MTPGQWIGAVVLAGSLCWAWKERRNITRWL